MDTSGKYCLTEPFASNDLKPKKLEPLVYQRLLYVYHKNSHFIKFEIGGFYIQKFQNPEAKNST